MNDINASDDSTLNVGWFPLIVVTLAAFIITIDISFLNVAITNLVHDLNTTYVTIQSIIVVYALVLASLTLLSGELQKVLSWKRTFLIGAGIFGVGNLIAALSLNSNMLLLGWSILEGIGGALMWVSMYSIIIGTYSGKKRAIALGLVASISSLGLIVGPFIGGFLTTYLSWRYAFGLEFIVILIILIFSKSIPSFPATMHWREIDIIGGINSALGIFY
jgi:MFS family permease